jgi:hypothetical protein
MKYLIECFLNTVNVPVPAYSFPFEVILKTNLSFGVNLWYTINNNRQFVLSKCCRQKMPLIDTVRFQNYPHRRDQHL